MEGSFRPASGVEWKTVLRPGAWWVAIAVALCAGVFWSARGNLTQIADQLLTADWKLACAALVLLVSVDLAKAWRWQVLYGVLRPPYHRVLQAQVVAQAANTIIPLRLGEVLRVSWAAPSASGIARGTAGLVLTKAVDALVLAGLVAWLFGGSLVAQAQLMPAVGLGVLVAIGLGIAQRYRHIGGGGLGAVKPLLRAAARYARELHAGTLAAVLATSGFAWVVGGLANIAVLLAVGVTPSPDLAGRILVSGYIAGLLPAPPGRLGVYEGAVAAALVSGGLDVAAAITVALVLHALQLLEIGLLVLAATRWR